MLCWNFSTLYYGINTLHVVTGYCTRRRHCSGWGRDCAEEEPSHMWRCNASSFFRADRPAVSLRHYWHRDCIEKHGCISRYCPGQHLVGATTIHVFRVSQTWNNIVVPPLSPAAAIRAADHSPWLTTTTTIHVRVLPPVRGSTMPHPHSTPHLPSIPRLPNSMAVKVAVLEVTRSTILSLIPRLRR